jgi:hypothetical protein
MKLRGVNKLNNSRIELKYELISDTLYTDVVIVPLEKDNTQSTGFVEKEPIEMEETATFESRNGSVDDSWWNLVLYPYYYKTDRNKFLNVRYVRLYKYLYQVDPEKDPWLNGKPIYRRPLLSGLIFERPGDMSLRGYGNKVAFFKRKNLKENFDFED